MRNVCGLLVALAMFGAGSARAQNALQNPDFEISYAGWNTNGGIGSTDWVMSPDHTGPGGSIRLRGYSFGSDTLYQCVAIVGGAQYDFGAWSWQASGQECSGTFTGNSVRLTWFTSTTCTNGSDLAFIDASAASMFDQWQKLQATEFPAPPNARSALLVLAAYCNQFQKTFEGFFDDAFVTSDIIFRNAFE